MRSIHLFQCQMGNMLGHGFSQVGRQRLVSQRLDEKQGGRYTAVEDSEFLFVVDLPSAVPVYFQRISNS